MSTPSSSGAIRFDNHRSPSTRHIERGLLVLLVAALVAGTVTAVTIAMRPPAQLDVMADTSRALQTAHESTAAAASERFADHHATFRGDLPTGWSETSPDEWRPTSGFSDVSVTFIADYEATPREAAEGTVAAMIDATGYVVTDTRVNGMQAARLADGPLTALSNRPVNLTWYVRVGEDMATIRAMVDSDQHLADVEHIVSGLELA